MTQTHERIFGPYAIAFWLLMLCNVLVPQALWFQRVRSNVYLLFIISLIVSTGMWLERFVIVVGSLARSPMESKWAMYYPTFWDITLFVGTIGLFLALLFL